MRSGVEKPGRRSRRLTDMVTTIRLFAVLVGVPLLVLTSGCGGVQPNAAASGVSPLDQATEAGAGRFDPLSISLILRSDRVASGGTIRTRLLVENSSPESVTDPECLIGTGKYAFVPVNDPDAELWSQPIADCGGPFEMKPGFRDESDGPSFRAQTKYGDPLPAGQYLAVLKIDGLSQRLEYPVTVE